MGLSVGVSAAENPTVTIVPIQGKEFTGRVLTPLEDTAFEFPVFQGVPKTRAYRPHLSCCKLLVDCRAYPAGCMV